jgi:alpha-amylase
VYQGQEQHFNGSITPSNRETVWSSGYNKEAPLYVLTSVLNKLRNNAIKLSLKKGPSGSQIVFCINNKSSSGDSYQVSVGGFEANDKVVEVLRCKVSTADVSGNVTMYMGKGEPKVYVPQAALKDTGLCTTTEEDAPVADNGASALGLTGSMLMAAVFGWAAVLLV